jgi:hypothetical protein
MICHDIYDDHALIGVLLQGLQCTKAPMLAVPQQ